MRFPEAKASDLQRWRRLVRLAGQAAEHPMRQTGDLFAASCAVAKAILPVPPESRANPFIQLRDTAVRFCADKPGRFAIRRELGPLAKTCADLLSDEPPSTPAAAAVGVGRSRLPYAEG